MIAARILTSSNPYATAIRLLQAGANMPMRRAVDVVAALPAHLQSTLAAYADSDDPATTVIERLVNTERADLDACGLTGVVDEVCAAVPAGRAR